MRPRGDESDDQQEPTGGWGRGRRWGRGRPEPAEEPVDGEELGWLADLRSAKAARSDLGPGEGQPGPATDPATAGRP
ncbi:MAG TPA: hypothetical protein VES42_08460, partial [Pilimelia sp.]|nr:hypothetical protein [Pilimelia sp.]